MTGSRMLLKVVAVLVAIAGSAGAQTAGRVYRGVMATHTRGLRLVPFALTSRQPIELELPPAFEKAGVGSPFRLVTTHVERLAGKPFRFALEGVVTARDSHPNGDRSVTVRFSGPGYHADMQRVFDDLRAASPGMKATVRGGFSEQVFRLRADDRLEVSGRARLELGGIRDNWLASLVVRRKIDSAQEALLEPSR